MAAGEIKRAPAPPSQDVAQQLATAPSLSATHKLRSARVDKVFENARPGQACTVAGLAAELDLSKSYLSQLFKQQTGLSLGRFLLEEKLQIAALLLRRTNLPIKRIAYAMGYRHIPSFTRAFERRFAASPRNYRRQGDRDKC